MEKVKLFEEINEFLRYTSSGLLNETNNLNEEEYEKLCDNLHNKLKYFNLNKRYVDPPIFDQKFALFSFIPTSGAKPDKDGFYGFAKIRGCYNTTEEAKEKAEDIIKNVDSTNPVFTVNIGRPIPVCSTKYAKETEEIDLQKKTEETISEHIRKKHKEDQKEIEDIKTREKELKEDVEKPVDPEDEYTTKRVKLANFKYLIEQHTIKLQECEALKRTCLDDLLKTKKENPEYEDIYMQKYMESRRKANIPEDTDMTGFMKYMADMLEEPKKKMRNKNKNKINNKENISPEKINGKN